MKKLHPIAQELLNEIDWYCTHADITYTKFGKLVMGNDHFVFRLKKGLQPRFVTVDRVRNYIKRRTKAVIR